MPAIPTTPAPPGAAPGAEAAAARSVAAGVSLVDFEPAFRPESALTADWEEAVAEVEVEDEATDSPSDIITSTWFRSLSPALVPESPPDPDDVELTAVAVAVDRAAEVTGGSQSETGK